MSLICNKRSAVLFEIIVATLIFSLVVAGLVSIFVASRRHMQHARERMTSSEMGKLFLEPLQLAVLQETWNSNALNLGTFYCDSDPAHAALQNPACPAVASQRIINNINYTVRYDVTNVPGTDLRKVIATVHWDEN